MTYDEALAKRNKMREQRHQTKGDFCDIHEDMSENKLFEKLLNDEYNWGYWDAVITIMKELKLKEITA
jgi:hypothetical protein